MSTLGLPFDTPDDAPAFDGDDYDPKKDHARLGKQAIRIFKWMQLGGWWSLPELAAGCGDPEASISAQLRHFRKPRFGAHTLEKRRRNDGGLYEYRLTVNPQARLDLLGVD